MPERRGDPVVGKRLRRAREDAGLEQDEAAQRLGVSRVTLSRRENGHVPVTEAEVTRMLQVYRSDDTSEAQAADASDDAWSPNPALRGQVPGRAYEVAMGYMQRLVRAGLTRPQLEELERVLLDSRYARQNSRRAVQISEDDHILLIDDAWDAIRETLAIYGVRP